MFEHFLSEPGFQKTKHLPQKWLRVPSSKVNGDTHLKAWNPQNSHLLHGWKDVQVPYSHRRRALLTFSTKISWFYGVAKHHFTMFYPNCLGVPEQLPWNSLRGRTSMSSVVSRGPAEGWGRSQVWSVLVRPPETGNILMTDSWDWYPED